MSKLITTARPRLTEPLGTVTAVFGGFVLLTFLAAVALSFGGSGSFGGFGHTTICVDRPNVSYSGDDWTRYLGVGRRAGTGIAINSTLQACALHPSAGQRILYTLLDLPGALVWGAVLFLLWWVIRQARETGPFTLPVALAMRRLGWLIIIGTGAAAAVQGFALDQLLNTMLRPPNDHGDVLSEPFHALLPVPLLAGAALITVSRIIRRGAEMDAELRATV